VDEEKNFYSYTKKKRAQKKSNGGAPATLDINDLGDDEAWIEPRGWLQGSIFCRGFVSSLLSEGGVGKTSLRYLQLLSSVTGRALAGDHIFQRARVLVVSLEDDRDELRRRFRAAMIHHEIKASEVRGWLYWVTPAALGLKLMTMSEERHSVRGHLADLIEEAIVRLKIDIIYLDPFIKTHGMPENDNQLIDDVMTLLIALAAKHNIAVDVPHHVSKGANEPGNARRGRGASAMIDAGRLVYTIAAMTAEEASAFGVETKDRRFLVRMDSAKVNIAPPASEARWFKLVGVPLGNVTTLYPSGDVVQTVEPWKPPDAWGGLSAHKLNEILDDIDKGLPDGQLYSNAPKAGDDIEAWRLIQQHAPDKPEKMCRSVISKWLASGTLFATKYRNPVTRKEVSGLRVDPGKRPG
jgi:hypothetical protein